MDRIKSLLTLAPIVAVAIAILYLQGYWGSFGISPFPYLGFQELVAYSALPFFGLIITLLAGVLLGLAERKDAEMRGIKEPKWGPIAETVFVLSIPVLTFYLYEPAMWVTGALAISSVIAVWGSRLSIFDALREKGPVLVLLAALVFMLLPTTFGYGRSHAEVVKSEPKNNVKFTLEAGVEEGNLVGKLGDYYFFLGAEKKLVQLPAQSIKRIEYGKNSHVLW